MLLRDSAVGCREQQAGCVGRCAHVDVQSDKREAPGTADSGKRAAAMSQSHHGLAELNRVGMSGRLRERAAKREVQKPHYNSRKESITRTWPNAKRRDACGGARGERMCARVGAPRLRVCCITHCCA